MLNKNPAYRPSFQLIYDLAIRYHPVIALFKDFYFLRTRIKISKKRLINLK